MKEVQLSIPTPCHADWQAMLPEEKGRFCLSCQKTVIDFSMMSDPEILKHIANNSKNICGNFAPDQLDRQIKELPLRKRNIFRYAWNMAAAFLIFSTKTIAQMKPVKDTIVCGPTTKVDEGEVATIRGKMISNTIIKGKVTDTLGNPIAFASVLIKELRQGVATDEKGNFSISTQAQYPFTLSVSYVGFSPAEIVLSREQHDKPVMVQLKQQFEGWLGGAVVITRVKKKKKVINLFKKKETAVCVKPVVEPKLAIFPNPATVQQEVKIQFKGLALGEWQMNLYNSAGTLLSANPITVSSTDQTSAIPSFYTKMAGLYVIELTNASLNKKVTGKLLVQ